MAGRSIVVIGGSSGALEGLRVILAGLPPDLDASIFVTIHTSANTPGFLDRILARSSSLRAEYAVDGEPIVPGRVYLAPPDRHLIIKPDHMRVTNGPRENNFRPAVDPLFRTAAAVYGQRVIGVILSGAKDDGAVGLAFIKKKGGVALVQDPAEALSPSMPEAAITNTSVDHVVSVRDMPAVLSGLISRQERQQPPEKEEAPMMEPYRDVAEGGAHDIHHANDLGPPSPFTCPDCGGTLWQSDAGELLQFQCHVGHRYSEESLRTAQDEALEQALWTALRALEESAELRRRMSRRAFDRGMTSIAETYDQQAGESEQRARTIRRVLMPDVRQPGGRTEPQPAGSTD